MADRKFYLSHLCIVLLVAGVVPRLSAQDLNVYFITNSDVVAPGDRLTCTLVASNTGVVDLTDVAVQVQWPQGFSGPGVIGDGLRWTGSNYEWTVDALAPGESRTMTFFVNVPNNAASGVLTMDALASATGASDVPASTDFVVDPTPLLRLSLAPDAGPAVAGEVFRYRLTFGNVGATSPSDVVLRMPLPEGTSFVSASDGGVESGGVVTWDVGTLGVGASRRVDVMVLPDAALPDGRFLVAEAELDAGIATEVVVRSSSVIPVRRALPLHVAYGMSQEALAPDDRVTYTLVASNTGLADLTDVYVEVQWLPGFPGPGVVGDNFRWTGDSYGWTVGALAPGESRTATFFVNIPGNVGQGEVLPSVVVASASGTEQVTAMEVLQVDPTPLLRLSVAPDAGPAVAGEAFRYRLTFGNVGATSPSDVVLRMPLPEGASFVSSPGGILNNGVVTWNVGTLSTGAGGQVSLTVLPDANLASGDILAVEGVLDSGMANELVIRSSAATPVGTNPPLQVSFTSDQQALEPGEPVAYTLEASNTGAVDLTDVYVEVQWPPGFPGPQVVGDGFRWTGDSYGWTVGAMAPGQTRTVTFTVNVPGNTVRGSIVRSAAAANATGSRQVTLQQDVLVGTRIDIQPANQPPSTARITSPEDGAGLIVGGAGGDHPADSATPVVVEWTASGDPEGDPLVYTWQLSPAPNFGSLLIEAPSADGGTATRFETDFGTLGEVLVSNGVALGGMLTLYHRVVTSDGQSEVVSDPFSIVLTRGTIVAAEEEAALPDVFALHGNYPNPFNPATTFAFDLPEPVQVTLTVFDMAGREVGPVVSARLPAGAHQVTWDAGKLPSGVYLYRLTAGSYVETQKLMLLK